jgi:hypothetical protein
MGHFVVITYFVFIGHTFNYSVCSVVTFDALGVNRNVAAPFLQRVCSLEGRHRSSLPAHRASQPQYRNWKTEYRPYRPRLRAKVCIWRWLSQRTDNDSDVDQVGSRNVSSIKQPLHDGVTPGISACCPLLCPMAIPQSWYLEITKEKNKSVKSLHDNPASLNSKQNAPLPVTESRGWQDR